MLSYSGQEQAEAQRPEPAAARTADAGERAPGPSGAGEQASECGALPGTVRKECKDHPRAEASPP